MISSGREGSIRRLAAILIADVAGYSRLMGRDDIETARMLAGCREVARDRIGRHGGRVADIVGDCILAEFPSVVAAVRCAIDIQHGLTLRASEGTDPEPMRLRIGVHLGDVLVTGRELFGDGINVAARLQALAEPGGICISRAVHDQIRDRIPVPFEDVGEHEVKNIARPVGVFRLPAATLAALSPEASAPGPMATRSRNAISLGLAGAALALAALAAAALGPLWFARESPEEGAITMAAADPGEAVESAEEISTPMPRVLALPLASDAEHALLADGLTDDLIGGLSRFPALRVLGRNTSNALQAMADDRDVLRAGYGVDYVVSGALRVIGNDFRLSIQVTETDSGDTRWSETYRAPLEDIFETSDEVVRDVVARVAVHVSRAELARFRQQAPANMSAYELTLQGRQLWRRPSPETLPRAQALLQQAIEADPGYPPAYAYAAFTNLTSYNNIWSEDFGNPEALGRMLRFASTALELDPGYSTAYAAQAIAYTYLGRHDEAAAAAGRAERANPNDPDVLGRVAQVLSFSGEHEQAILILARAIDLDPFGPAQWFNFLSRAHFFLGADHEAIVAARSCLERSQIVPCLETLTAALAHSGQWEEAAESWLEIARRRPGAEPEGLVARLRPAFKRQADLDRLVAGLTRAQEAAMGL